MACAYINIICIYLCLNRCRSVRALCVCAPLSTCEYLCMCVFPNLPVVFFLLIQFDFSSIFASSFFIYRIYNNRCCCCHRNRRSDHHHAQLKCSIDGFSFFTFLSFLFFFLFYDPPLFHIFINLAFKIVCLSFTPFMSICHRVQSVLLLLFSLHVSICVLCE